MSEAYPSPSVVDAKPVEVACSARRYVPELDGLRGLAVLLVILYHSAPDGPFQGGFIGVDLFFVLSAFLISSILVEEQERIGRIRFAQFYWRRALRLMPALLLFLATYVVVGQILFPGYPHFRDALIAGTYLSNFAYVAAQIPALITHTWSLAAEEQFYLLWPVTLLLLLRTTRPVLILGALWVALTFLRFSTDDINARYIGFAQHGTGLVLGAILFFLLRERKLSFRPICALVAGAGLLILSANAKVGAPEMPILLAEVASAVLIGTAITNQGSLPFLAARPLVGLGKLSYGLYLWHYPISRILRAVGGFWSTFTVTFALSLGLAWLSFVTVESWARRLRGEDRAVTGASAQITV